MHEIDPRPLFEVGSGFMAAKHLFVADELGVFRALAGGPLTVAALAERLDVSVRAARISADAMVALGFLERDDGTYRNGAVAAAHLAPDKSLTPMLRFWNRLSYGNWGRLADALRGDRPATPRLSAEEGEIFSAGVEAITAGTAHALAAAYPFQRHRRLLDVGGGTGSFLLAALRSHPHVRGTLVEIEPALSVARGKIAASPVGDRIDVLGADALADPLPAAHDAILVANLAHLLSPERNRQLLRRLRAVADDQARLLLVDFWTDATHTDPPFAALMAGEFALYSGEGDVYSADEIRSWLAESGWRPLSHEPLAGPQSLITAAPA
jgi:SAM-dependent methyltransferase